MRGYTILKCDFHSHYHQYGDRAEVMVDAYFNQGYDCMALTEHSHRMQDLDIELKMGDYVEEKYGSDFVYIVGEEIDFSIEECSGHLGSLFLEEYINPKTENGKMIPLSRIVDVVHEQGGIAFIAHDVNWEHWKRRKQCRIDGWEVGSPYFNNRKAEKSTFLSSRLDEVAEEGYITLSNTDSHSVEDLGEWGRICHTYVFAHEKSVEGVKEALSARRTVAYFGGLLFGEEEWVCQLRNELDRSFR